MGVIEEERRKDLQDIKSLMDSAQGRRIVWRLLEQGKVFNTTFSIDQPVMCFQEGARNIALSFLADVMEIAPKKLQVMMLEAKERRDLVCALMAKEEETNYEEN